MPSKPKSIHFNDIEQNVLEMVFEISRYREKSLSEIGTLLESINHNLHLRIERNEDKNQKVIDISRAVEIVVEWEDRIRESSLEEMVKSNKFKIFIPFHYRQNPILFLLSCACVDNIMAYPMRYSYRVISSKPADYFQIKLENIQRALRLSRSSGEWLGDIYMGHNKNNLTERYIDELKTLSEDMNPLITLLENRKWELKEVFDAYVVPKSKPTRLYFYASLETIYRLLAATFRDDKSKVAAAKAREELQNFFQKHMGVRISLDEIRNAANKLNSILPVPGPQVAKLLALQEYLKFFEE